MYVPKRPFSRAFSSLYVEDMATLKEYGQNGYKLTLHRRLRQPGWEVRTPKAPRGTANEEKLECNISRARSKIFEYGACNPWELFVTLTLDRMKYDRHDLKKFIKDLTQWLRDYCKKHKCQVKYLFIPEQHEDGAWHIHGLLMGLPLEHLSDFIPGKHPQKLIDKGYKNWEPYANKFGFVSADIIRNHEAVSKYLTKYISKDMVTNNRQLGACLYYCSKGLKEAVEIKRGSMVAAIKPDYENDHVKVQWFKEKATALALLG